MEGRCEHDSEPESAIHKVAGSLVSGHSQNVTGRNTPQRPFPLYSLRDIFPVEWWNDGIAPGTAGNREAGSFVNSAVN